MDIDNIFKLFGEEPEESINDHVVSKGDSGISKTPIYKLGMYKKIIQNHVNFNTRILGLFKDANSELDIEEINKVGEALVFGRAWRHIQDINPKELDHLIAIYKYSGDDLNKTLILGISFFELHEQYEKCAILKSILDKSQEMTT
jgi:hypothetical protein